MNSKKAIVLLSGGIDSATVLYQAKAEGYKVRALSFDYGQRHKKELSCARKLARASDTQICVLKIMLPWKGSCLLEKNAVLPKGLLSKKEIPRTYVPSRNIVFLSFALSYAESTKASIVFIGANQIDYSNYPDCRKDFIDSFNLMASKGTAAGVSGKPVLIKAPLIKKSKKEIIIKAASLGVPFQHTWSCYKGAIDPCGVCDSCIIRKNGFKQAGIKDTLGTK